MIKLRPRFSVRTLAIFVTLICAYFGAWEATTRYGDSQQGRGYILGTDEVEIHGAFAIAPFLLRQDEYWESNLAQDGKFAFASRYYLWLFGPKIKLPFESHWDGW